MFHEKHCAAMRLVHRSTNGRLPTSTFELKADDGQVLGFSQVRHRPSCSTDLPPEAANNIYYEIDKAHRGRGYGKELMRLTLVEASRIGLDKVRLTVDDDNPISRHIVEQHGAIWIARFHREDGRYCDLFEISVR